MHALSTLSHISLCTCSRSIIAEIMNKKCSLSERKNGINYLLQFMLVTKQLLLLGNYQSLAKDWIEFKCTVSNKYDLPDSVHLTSGIVIVWKIIALLENSKNFLPENECWVKEMRKPDRMFCMLHRVEIFSDIYIPKIFHPI